MKPQPTIRIVIWALALGAPAARAVDKSERTWKSNCASCHGDDGKGQTVKGKAMRIADMTTPSWQNGFTEEKIKVAIEDGIDREKVVPAPASAVAGPKITVSAADAAAKTVRVKQQMDAYKSKLKPDVIDGLVLYVRQFGR